MKEVNIYRPMLDYSANESYKSLRTNLLFCGEEKKVIAITSCTPNEGKSTVSLNLALSLADSGKKVLLIDADLRKSVLLGRTEVDQEIKGLSHLLSHQETIENVIYSTNIPRFNIIYAGTVPPNPAELLGAEYFKRVLAAVKKVYDYIIIDTAPAMNSILHNCLIAADDVIIPVTADRYSLQGLSLLNETIKSIKKRQNPKLTVAGLLLTKYNSRANLSREVRASLETVAESMNTKIFDTSIRECIKVKEAQAQKRTLIEYAPNCTAAEDYNRLADELTG